MDYQLNRLYFFPIPAKGFGCAITLIAISTTVFSIVGFVAFQLSNASKFGALFIAIGLILSALGILWIVLNSRYNKKRRVVSDAEIDAVCKRHLQDLKEKALRKLGIDEEQVQEADPIKFDGYYFNSVAGSVDGFKQGYDREFRTPNYNAVIFLFSSEQVYCYQYRFSLLDNKIEETTDEYFYSDIVSVSTKSESKNFGRTTITYEQFSLTTSGGTSIGASLSDTGAAERSINGMKTLLRTKKQKHQ
jgi:hypothetical protein